MRRFLLTLFVLAPLFFAAAPLRADTSDSDANRVFVEAMQLVQKADNTYDTRESVRLLRGANQLLKKIIASYPQSAIAVQLSTHQLIGDFDVSEFEARVRALSCERGSYVEEFLSEYGIASSTGPTTEACFLYRMESVLNPPDQPLTAARPDWLAVAVDYYLFNQPERARALILPYLGLLRKTGQGDAQDSYPVLARALLLTGADDQAQQVTDRIGDCSGRLSTMLFMLKTAQFRNDAELARNLAEAMRDYAESNQCDWQRGIVVQGYSLTGQDKEAKALFDKLMARLYQGVGQSPDERAAATPPELAIAASMGADVDVALQLARAMGEKEPNAVLAVIRNLAARGEFQAAHDLAAEMKDAPRKAFALAALIAAAPKDDDKKAASWMSELTQLRNSAVQSAEQCGVLTALARAEKARYKDERWRGTFQSALNAAERADDSAKPQLVTNLAATLAFIKTGKGILD